MAVVPCTVIRSFRFGGQRYSPGDTLSLELRSEYGENLLAHGYIIPGGGGGGGGGGGVTAGTLAARPAADATQQGVFYHATDTTDLYVCLYNEALAKYEWREVTLSAAEALISAWTRTEAEAAAVTKTGTWNTYSDANTSGGSYLGAQVAGNILTFTFTGMGIRFIATKSSGSGIARVTVDSEATTTINLYSATLAYQQVAYERTDLTNASHTIKIEPDGTKDALSSGTWIYADAFDVGT